MGRWTNCFKKYQSWNKKSEFILISGKRGRGKSILGNIMNGLVLLLEQKQPNT